MSITQNLSLFSEQTLRNILEDISEANVAKTRAQIEAFLDFKVGHTVRLNDRNGTIVSDDNGYWLYYSGGSNRVFFEGIDEPGKWVQELLGYSVMPRGVFPMCKTLEDLKKVIKALKAHHSLGDGSAVVAYHL